MVNYHEGPAFDVSSENSKHAFIPLATTTIRRSRVRQRLSFAQRPTQVIMTSLPPASTSLRDRKQQHQQRPNDNHSNTLEISIDSGRRIFNNSAVHASRVSGGSGSMDNHYQVPKTQKRIKDAGNCRRWTDVRYPLVSWIETNIRAYNSRLNQYWWSCNNCIILHEFCLAIINLPGSYCIGNRTTEMQEQLSINSIILFVVTIHHIALPCACLLLTVL